VSRWRSLLVSILGCDRIAMSILTRGFMKGYQHPRKHALLFDFSCGHFFCLPSIWIDIFLCPVYGVWPCVLLNFLVVVILRPAFGPYDSYPTTRLGWTLGISAHVHDGKPLKYLFPNRKPLSKHVSCCFWWIKDARKLSFFAR